MVDESREGYQSVIIGYQSVDFLWLLIWILLNDVSTRGSGISLIFGSELIDDDQVSIRLNEVRERQPLWESIMHYEGIHDRGVFWGFVHQNFGVEISDRQI